MREKWKKHSWAIPALLILAWGIHLIFTGLGTGSLSDYDEAHYAIVARQTALNNHWLILHYSDTGRWFLKPPLNIWMMALSFKALGIHELSVRLPSALMAILAVAACLWLGRTMASWAVGCIAGYLLLSAPLFLHNSRAGMTDSTVLFFMLVTVVAYLLGRQGNRKWFLLCGMAAGCGVLSKYLAGLLGFGVLAPLIVKDWAEGRIQRGALGRILLSFSIIALPWYVYACLVAPGEMKWLLYGHNIYERFILGQSPSLDPYFVSNVLKSSGSHPFNHLALLACVYAWAECLRRPDRNQLVLAAWLLLGLGVLYTTRSQYFQYALPFYPGIALAIAFLVMDFVRRQDSGLASLAVLWSVVETLRRHGGEAFVGMEGVAKAAAVAAVLGVLIQFGPRWSAALGRPLRILVVLLLALNTIAIPDHHRPRSEEQRLAEALDKMPLQPEMIVCYSYPPCALMFYHEKYPIEFYGSLRELQLAVQQCPGDICLVLRRSDREAVEKECGTLPVVAQTETIIALAAQKEELRTRFPWYVDFDYDPGRDRLLLANERGRLEWQLAGGERIAATGSAKALAAVALLPSGEGYYALHQNGVVSAFGQAVHRGNAGVGFSQRAVDIVLAPEGAGYYVLLANGKVQSLGAPPFPGWQEPPADGMIAFSRAPSGEYWCGLTRSGWLVWAGAPQPYPFQQREPYYLGRDVQLTERGGLVLDGFGALHAFGSESHWVNPGYFMNDIFVALEVLPDGRIALLDKRGEIFYGVAS